MLADVGGIKEMVAAEIMTSFGSIVYYNNGTERYFVAHCQHSGTLGHSKNCRMKRRANSNKSHPGQGRPLGLLLAWLEAGHIGVEMPPGGHIKYIPSFDVRQRKRTAFLATTEGREFVGNETDTEEDRRVVEPPNVR